LSEAFSIDRIVKAGAKFDFVKATWFNQQYLMATDNADLAKQLRPLAAGMNYDVSDDFLAKVAGMMKERVNFLPEILTQGSYFFGPLKSYDEKTIRKRWKPERQEKFETLKAMLSGLESFEPSVIEENIKAFLTAQELGFGDVFPILRVALSGTTKGPDVFQMIALLGKDEVVQRLETGYASFNEIAAKKNAI